MKGLQLLILASAVAVGILLQHPGPNPLPEFVQVADGAYRLTQWWRFFPGLPAALPVAVGLLRGEGGNWVLVDTGFRDSPRQRHASHLLAALHAVIPHDERLAAIALTHGHFDHALGLPVLLAAFPTVPVVAHAIEAPYLQGQSGLYMSKLFQTVYQALGLELAKPLQVPSDRLQLLEGAAGDLGAWGGPAIAWAHAPGHTPGHTVFLHTPSGVLLAGDAVSFIKPSPCLDSAPDSKPPADSQLIASWKPLAALPRLNLRTAPGSLCYQPNCNPDVVDRTLCVLLGRDLDFRLLVAGHDAAAGAVERGAVTAEALQASMPGLDCGKYLRQADAAAATAAAAQE